MSRSGGYDAGYRACPCFWGTTPGSFVTMAVGLIKDLDGKQVLDIGCGEGKNAAYLAKQGAKVLAMDISEAALANARLKWSGVHDITWRLGDVSEETFGAATFDVVVAYGLLHCLTSELEIAAVISKLQRTTRRGGFNIVCAFNARAQDLRAHPEFQPTLLPHNTYLSFYEQWRIVASSDRDLRETHPHNQIEHVHSLTRILAQKRDG